jgi:ribonucleoside-triphosphate reductase
VPVDFAIPYAKKLAIEAPFHKLCNAGHISYVEFDDYPTGEQIEKIIRQAYDTTNINYLGMNFHIRYCLDCAARMREEKNKHTNRTCACDS